MEIKHPRISALFDAKVSELALDGIVPTPRESVWLHALCEDAVFPDRSDVSTWLSPVVTVGRVNLYPLTIQARLWIDAYVSKWWSDDYLMDILATAWAMNHGQVRGAFKSMTVKWKARVIITAWAVSLPITFEQLREGLRRHFGTDGAIQAESPLEPKYVDPLAWGELMARAVVMSKQSPEQVLLWNESQFFDVLLRGKDGEAAKSDQPKIRALEALRIATVKIKEAHKEQVAA